MKLKFNKDILGQEILYCGQLLGPSFVQWEISEDRNIRSYGCFNPLYKEAVLLSSINGAEADTDIIEVYPLFRPGELVYLKFEALTKHMVFKHYISSVVITYTPQSILPICSYFIREYGFIIESEIMSIDTYRVMQEIEKANK